MRWPNQMTRAPTHSQRTTCIIAALPVVTTTFAIHAMVGCHSPQIKMPRPDAYLRNTKQPLIKGETAKCNDAIDLEEVLVEGLGRTRRA